VTEDVAFTDAYVYVLFPFLNVIKPINYDVQLLNNKSSHGSFQLGGAGMGKSHWGSVLFTYNMGTDDSSTGQ
jgi:hypothetical protein